MMVGETNSAEILVGGLATGPLEDGINISSNYHFPIPTGGVAVGST